MAKMINLSMKLKRKVGSLWQPNAKNRGSLGESDRRAHISPKMGGLWVTTETISQNMGSLGDSSTENRGVFGTLHLASPP